MKYSLFEKVIFNIDIYSLIISFTPKTCAICNINLEYKFLIGKKYKCLECGR